ncbi:MAG: tetratricopeptide repeat protein [Candidatus Poseidoniaceae archaeon]
MDDFDGFQERYNIAAKLGEHPQYRSDFLKYENDEVYGVQIIKVLATKDCSTFDQVVIDKRLNLLKRNEIELQKVMKAIAKEYFRQVDDDFDLIPPMSSEEFEHVLPRLKDEDDECYQKTMRERDKWQPLRIRVTYKGTEYHVVHGDEWPGNFLTSEDLQDAYFMDFEDALFAEAKEEVSTVQSVGGDLASRIVSEKKTNNPKFTPAALNIFGSIGRLIAAVVQFGSIRSQVKEDYIERFLNRTLAEFKEALENKNDALADNWKQFQTQILLHAWDWALYWIERGRFRNPYAERFIDEIKKLLCGEEAQTDEQKPITYPSPPDTGPRAMPSDNTEAREEKKIRDIIIEKADDDAWDSYSTGDLAKAEANWGIALKMLNEMKSNEDKGYFSYFKTKVAYLRNDDADKAVESLLQCIKFCQDDDDDAYLMEALLFLAYLRRISGTRTQAVGVLNQLVYLYNTGDFEESPESFDNEQLMEWPESEGDYKHTVLCQIKRMVANFFWKFGEYENASRLYENLMQYFEGTQQHDRSDNARVNLGILKSKLGEYEESDKLQNQCLEYRRKEYAKVNDGDTGEITKALRNLGQNAMAWAKDLDQPVKINKLEDAVGYFSECIELLEAQNEDFFESPDQKEQFISFNIRLLQRCKLDIKIGEIYALYDNREERYAKLIEMVPLFPEYEIAIRLRVIDNCTLWKDIEAHLLKIDYNKCDSNEISYIVLKILYWRRKYGLAKELIRQQIRRFDQDVRIMLCSVLEDIRDKELEEEDFDFDDITRFHKELCKIYDVEYESSLTQWYGEKKIPETSKRKYAEFVVPQKSESEYQSLVRSWKRLSPVEVIGLSRCLQIHLTYRIHLQMHEVVDGKPKIFDPHTRPYTFDRENPIIIVEDRGVLKSRFQVAKSILDNSNDFERVFNQHGLPNLHMAQVVILVTSYLVLIREEKINPTRKETIRKQLKASINRTKGVTKDIMSNKEFEIYRRLVNTFLLKNREPMTELIPDLIDELRDCKDKLVKFSLLSIIELATRISPVFGSPTQSRLMTPKSKLSTSAKTSLNLIMGKLEAWIIEEPSVWGRQLHAIMDGDVRVVYGRFLLREKLALSEDEWPEVFRQTEQSEEEDLQEL